MCQRYHRPLLIYRYISVFITGSGEGVPLAHRIEEIGAMGETERRGGVSPVNMNLFCFIAEKTYEHHSTGYNDSV